MDNQQKVDALLNLANKSQESKKGKLKIFLGYAPGVGKSYAMLNNARALQKDNKDVVVGLLVSHGRADTQALLEGLEIMPLKKVNYRGRVFEELDIDAIKARKPDVVIVDELPHSNLPTSRNKKGISILKNFLMRASQFIRRLIFNILLAYLMRLHSLLKLMLMKLFQMILFNQLMSLL